jgi:hypothetical protein
MLRPTTHKERQARDHFLWLRMRAYEAIAEARKRTGNDIGFYTVAEVKTARDFLRDLGNEARNSGKPKGGRPQVQENRKVLQPFYLVSQGRRPKEIATEMSGSNNYERMMRSLSVQMKRFSQRVGKVFCSRYGKVPESILQPDAPKGAGALFRASMGASSDGPGSIPTVANTAIDP